jgi:outer membrane protein
MNRSLVHAAVVLWTAASLVVAPVFAQAQEQSQAPIHMPGQLATEQQDQQNQQSPPPTTPQQTQAPPAQMNQTSAPSTAAGPVAQKRLTPGPDYSKGKSIFPNPFSPYGPIHVDEPNLTNTPKIDQLIQDGKLMLSLDDAVSLALENNLDIRLQRYNLWVIDTQLLKAKAGGIPQPASNQQISLGLPPSVSFDPVLTSAVNWSRQVTPVNQIFTSGFGTQAGAFSLIYYSANYNFGYTEGFHTGTAISVQWQNNRASTNAPGYLFNPAVQSALAVSISQPLLAGCCLLPNTRYIIEAKNSQKVAAAQFRQAVITDITTTSNDYWELVYDREAIRVQQQAVAVSQKLYEDNKKQLEIGTMAPLDVITAESQLASDKQQLVLAQTAMLLQEAKLLFDITKNPLAQNLAEIEIVPTTPVQTPEVVENVPLPDLMAEAWQNRPEMTVANLTLVNDKIEVRATRNSLLPSLNIFGQYQGIGLGGVNVSATTTGAAVPANMASLSPEATAMLAYQRTQALAPVAAATSTPIPATGLNAALNDMINATNPTYTAGLNFSMPIRNRSLQADSARTILAERQQEVSNRQLQNTIFVNVRQAQVQLEQDRAQVAATAEARKLAQQTLDAQQKKYQLGSSDSYTVVLRARDLTQAEVNEVRAQVNLIEAMVSFNQAMGRTLAANNITLADAVHGKVSHTPNIPGALDADGPAAGADAWAPGKK